MTHWRLDSLDVFDEPIDFHTQARDFHHFHADEIKRRAQALLDELRRSHPEHAIRFEQQLEEISKRFRTLGDTHHAAVGFHTTHRHWHAENERLLREGAQTERPGHASQSSPAGEPNV